MILINKLIASGSYQSFGKRKALGNVILRWTLLGLIRFVLILPIPGLVGAAPAPSAEGALAATRLKMVQDQIEERGVTNHVVLNAMRVVPRHEFVSENLLDEAYSDRPLPIGYGQTISQPYIVALMTELLNLKRGEKVLEVGTGSGYQAAILAQITTNVFTIEIAGPLANAAKRRLQKIGFSASQVVQGDGYYGLKDQAPFDAIIVTAAADHIPPPLLQQLRPEGRMVVPIGPVHATQRLVLVQKDSEGKVKTRSVLPVRFVPLTGGPKKP